MKCFIGIDAGTSGIKVVVFDALGRVCGTGYHDTFKRPAREDTCDKCGGHEFKRRPDDQPETVKNRLEVYHRQTAPLIDYYGKTGKVSVIDGDLSIEKVSLEIDTVINRLEGAKSSVTGG